VRIEVVTLFPAMIREAVRYGVTGRGVAAGLVEVDCVDPRDYATDAHRTVDDRPYGGGPGMVMTIEPLRTAIRAAAERAPNGALRIYLSAQGRRFDQQAARRFVNLAGLVLVAGRYEGVDERLLASEIDEEWSIGDYVLSGGEIPALALIDAVTRLIPGVLGNECSAVDESFSKGLLDWPHYTRPEDFEGMRVPDVLLSGNHREIERWRRKQALGRTWRRRPDLLQSLPLDATERLLLEEYRLEEFGNEANLDESEIKP
jgi:tRNA (guanine37-N1)-methyltransferase